MGNLIIDRGNTLTKWALFEGNELLRNGHLEANTTKALRKELSGLPKAEVVLVSSVKKKSTALTEWAAKASKSIEFTYLTPVPIKNAYKTPKTLGLDRLAAVIGAWNFYPGCHSLVIDFGTCIKYDFITNQAEYLGGNISPGMKMRFQALHQFTDKLPLLDYKHIDSIYGTCTESAIATGVIQGIEQEVMGTIALFQKQFDTINVILTGGDASVFEKQLKVPIFASPHLVLFGLNAILNYNAGK